MRRILFGAALVLVTAVAHAFEWSDTSIGWRYGTKFGEPFIAQERPVSLPSDASKVGVLQSADGLVTLCTR